MKHKAATSSISDASRSGRHWAQRGSEKNHSIKKGEEEKKHMEEELLKEHKR